MAGKRITRRDFIKATAAGALATGIGAPFIVPQRAYGASAKKSLKILQWVHFVPAFDKWFNEKYVKEWGDKNNTEVTVDNIGIAGISARAAAEVSAQKGHDIFLFNWPPPFYEEQVVDMAIEDKNATLIGVICSFTNVHYSFPGDSMIPTERLRQKHQVKWKMRTYV